MIKLNKVFREANECRLRYKVMLGSAGSGKSVNTATDYILKLSNPVYTGANLLVVRSTEVSHANSTFAELLSAINRCGLEDIWQTKTSPLYMKCKTTGNTILFRGCNDQRAIERLKSVTVSKGKICWVWIEEATECRQSDVEIIDDRLRGSLPDPLFYQITFTFNPISATHWLKTAFWDSPDPNIFRHKSTYLDNQFIDDEYHQRMERRKLVDPEGYQIYGLGNWGETSGLIFTNYDVGNYSKKQFDYYSIGCDFGYNHATVVLLIGWYDGEPYLLKEVYLKGKTNSEVISECDRQQIPKRVQMFCDSAEPDRIKEFRQSGYRSTPVRKERNSINNQITWLQNVHIHIDGSCKNTIKEIQAYRWAKDPVSGLYLDSPVPYDDDCMAALRYGIEPMRKQTRLKTISKEALAI